MNNSDKIYRDLQIGRILDRVLYVMFVAMWCGGIYLVVNAIVGRKP